MSAFYYCHFCPKRDLNTFFGILKIVPVQLCVCMKCFLLILNECEKCASICVCMCSLQSY